MSGNSQKNNQWKPKLDKLKDNVVILSKKLTVSDIDYNESELRIDKSSTPPAKDASNNSFATTVRSVLIPIQEHAPALLKPLAKSSSWTLKELPNNFIPFPNAVKFGTRYKLQSGSGGGGDETSRTTFYIMENVDPCSAFLFDGDRRYAAFVFSEAGIPLMSFEKHSKDCKIFKHSPQRNKVIPHTLPFEHPDDAKIENGVIVRLASGETLGYVVFNKNFVIQDSYRDTVMLIKRFGVGEFRVYNEYGNDLVALIGIEAGQWYSVCCGKLDFGVGFNIRLKSVEKALIIAALYHLKTVKLDRRRCCSCFCVLVYLLIGMLVVIMVVLIVSGTLWNIQSSTMSTSEIDPDVLVEVENHTEETTTDPALTKDTTESSKY